MRILYTNTQTIMKTIFPPHEIKGDFKIFLAGSIEMGQCEDWQQKIVEQFTDSDITFLNPRRKDWDSTWEQKIENAQFNEQVSWELIGLEEAELIVLYLDPQTKAPISLLEMGLFANSGKMIVCCPEGYWRKGNVDIVCKRYGVHQVPSLDELVKTIKTKALNKANL